MPCDFRAPTKNFTRFAIWFDDGSYTRDGSTVHAVSEYLEFVTFDGLLDDGTLRIDQDLAGNGVAARYEFSLAPGK